MDNPYQPPVSNSVRDVETPDRRRTSAAILSCVLWSFRYFWGFVIVWTGPVGPMNNPRPIPVLQALVLVAAATYATGWLVTHLVLNRLQTTQTNRTKRWSLFMVSIPDVVAGCLLVQAVGFLVASAITGNREEFPAIAAISIVLCIVVLVKGRLISRLKRARS